MRGDHQVLPGRDDAVDRRHRQIEPERLPPPSAVERHVDAVLGAEVQQPRLPAILADGPREIAGGNAAHDLRPGLAGVIRAVDVRRTVGPLVAVRRDECGAGLVRRRLDQADAGEIGQVLRRHVVPRPAAVARHVDQPVVRARPHRLAVEGRRGDREDGGIRLDARLVQRDWPPRRPHRRRIVPGEIGADAIPTLALVRRPPDVLRADVQHPRIRRRKHDRVGPLEPFRDVLRGVPMGLSGQTFTARMTPVLRS